MRLNWKTALGIALSVGLLVWTLRGESPSDIWAVISESNAALLIVAALVATAVFPLRAIRWRIILEPVAPNLPIAQLWRATAVGMMVNNIYPARLGEIARAYALTRETDRVSLTSAVASLAVDRVFDALTLMLLLVGAMLAPDVPGGITIGGQPVERARRAVRSRRARPVRRALRHRRVSAPLARHVRGDRRPSGAATRGAREHDHSAPSPKDWACCEPAAIRCRVFLGAGTLARECARLLDRLQGRSASTCRSARRTFLQGIIAIGVALPSSPGFFGVFEAAAKVGLEVYGVTGGLAVSWAIGYHVLSFIPITIIGLYYFARLGLHFSDFKAQPNEAR